MSLVVSEYNDVDIAITYFVSSTTIHIRRFNVCVREAFLYEAQKLHVFGTVPFLTLNNQQVYTFTFLVKRGSS